MKKITFLIIIIAIALDVSSQANKSFYTIGDGNWNDGSIWSKTSGGSAANDFPVLGEDAHIEGHDITLNMDLSTGAGIELYVTGGGTLTGTSYGLLIAANGNLDIVNGTVHVSTVDLKNGAIVAIEPDGELITDQFLTNDASITVDGVLNIGTVFTNTGTVSGNGTLSAATFAGDGELFGIAPTSSIAAGSSVGGWTWNSASSTDWNTSTNWAAGTVPTSTSNVVILSSGAHPILTGIHEAKSLTINSGSDITIAPNAQITITDSITNNAGTTGLVIQSTASGDGSLIFSTGAAPSGTIQRHVTGGEWNMITPSTTGTTAQTFHDITANDSWLSTFDEGTGVDGGTDGLGWGYISDLGTSLSVGTGYNYWPSVDETIVYTGSIQNTDFPATLSYSGGTLGYNLVGNPFSSAVEWNGNAQWGLSNIELSIWIWDGSQYNTYPTSSPHDIPLGQGVFVRALSSGATLTFPVSQRVHGSDAFQKNSQENSAYDNFLKVYTNGNGYSDRVQISFGENGTRGFENGWDATKMFGLEEAPQLFITEDDLTLSYDHLPVVEHGETTTVSLNLIAGGEGEHSINVDLEYYTGGEIILEDRLEDINHNLVENPVYTFNASKTDNDNRFLLHFAHSPNAVGDENMDNGEISIYSYGKDIYINSEENKHGTVTVYDLMGRVYHQQDIENKLEKIQLDINNSYVVVQVVTDEISKTEMVFIK